MKRNILAGLGAAAALLLAAAPVYAQSVAVSVQNLTPGTTLSAGTTATFNVIAAGFTNPTYSLSDSFGGSTVTSSDINSSGYFTWTPQSSDQGVHNVTVSISDTQGHVASIAVQFTVASAYVTIGTVTPSASVPAGQTVNFSTSITGFSNPSYALSDNFNGSTLNSGDINSGGFFSWTPSAADVGSHTVTVLAFDSSGHSASASTVINIGTGASITLTPVYPSTTVAPGTLVSFSATAANFVNPSFTITDSFSGTTVQSGFISSSGDFTWTPQSSDTGTHMLTITAYDTQGHTGSGQVTIVVASTGSIPVSNVSTTSSAPAYTFTEYLSPGSQDNEVLMLQQLLQREGYLTAAPTGYYGVATEDAVMKFQAAKGINTLGVVGPSTRVALNQLEQSLAGTATTVVPTTSSTVTSAQLQSELSIVESLLQQIQAEIQKMQAGQ